MCIILFVTDSNSYILYVIPYIDAKLNCLPLKEQFCFKKFKKDWPRKTVQVKY